MNETKPEFKISQEFELLLPQKKKAYPVLKGEWKFLKEKIDKIKDTANIYHTIGSVFLGITGSGLLAFFTYKKPNPVTIDYNTRLIITLGIIAVSLVCGVCFLFFGSKQRKLQNTSAKEVISQMNLIEQRYESDESETTPNNA